MHNGPSADLPPNHRKSHPQASHLSQWPAQATPESNADGCSRWPRRRASSSPLPRPRLRLSVHTSAPGETCPKSPKSLLGQLLFPWRAPAPAVGLGCPGCNTASAFSDEVTSTVAEAYYPIQRPLKARCASMGTRVHIHPVENVRLRRTTFYTDELMWDKVE